MILKEQLLMNHLAYQFIKNNQFELLHISEQNEEIWLEKYENRTSKVMRLTTRGFDWTNELKRDITNSINRIRLQQFEQTFYKIYLHASQTHSSHKEFDGAQVLSHPEHLEAPGRR